MPDTSLQRALVYFCASQDTQNYNAGWLCRADSGTSSFGSCSVTQLCCNLAAAMGLRPTLRASLMTGTSAGFDTY